MRPGGFYRAVWLYIAIASIVLLACLTVLLSLPKESEQPSLIGPAPLDLPAERSDYPGRPDTLISQSASGWDLGRATPPSMRSRAAFPDWVQSHGHVTVWAQPSTAAQAVEELPEGSYLRVMQADAGWFHVYYGGDGERHEAAEGWVTADNIAPAPAPRWVATRFGTSLKSDGGAGAQLTVALPGGAVLEVLEDLGRQLRVFYLGDGVARDAILGLVDISDLVPAGPMLAGEGRGVRRLGQADLESLRQGKGVWLKVPYRSQRDGSPSASANCGPASVGMVLDYFGIPVPTAELRALANRMQGTSDPESGVAIECLMGIVERFGLKGLDLYSGSRAFKPWSLDDIRSHLVHGNPVIPQLRFRLMPGRSSSDYGEDHYVVLTGVLGDDFIYSDPLDTDGPGFGRLMSAATLARAWGGSYFPFAAFAVSRP